MNIKDFKRLIAPLQKKIFLALGRAILKRVNNSESTQKIQIIALQGETITDMERFQEYGFESYPLADAEVAAIFLNGNRDQGIAICVHDRRYRPTDLVAGEIVIYTDEDSSDFRIHLKRGRIFDIKGDKMIEALDTSKTIITPECIVDSSEISLGGSNFAALKKLITEDVIAWLNAHVHSGVTAGGADTGSPTTTASTGSHATSKVKAG